MSGDSSSISAAELAQAQAEAIAELALAEATYARQHRATVALSAVVERGGPVSYRDVRAYLDDIGADFPGRAHALVLYAISHHAYGLGDDYPLEDIPDHVRALRARAEKAEQERDEALAKIDAHLTLCGGAPMTTVDEDGRVWRVERVENVVCESAEGREGAAVFAWEYADDPGCWAVKVGTPDPDDFPLHRLVPIEAAPSEGEGE